MEQPGQLPIADETEEPAEVTGEKREFEKPDFVKKIEGFDIHNLTPENIEFMTGVIQNYFLENFPVRPELVEQLPEHVNIIDSDEFARMVEEDEDNRNEGVPIPKEPSGFYDPEQDKIFINISGHRTPGGLFATMFHESLHCVGIENGAGLAGNFLWPEDYYEDKGIRFDTYNGSNTLKEGTTQLITLGTVVDEMGFDEQAEMFGYEAEFNIMDAIWRAIPHDEMLDAYFNMGLDDIRIHVDCVFEPEETRGTIGPTESNEIFAKCLYNLGITTRKMQEALESWGDGGDPDGVMNEVRHAVGLYMIRRCEMNGMKLPEEWKEPFREYLKPYEGADNNIGNREEEGDV